MSYERQVNLVQFLLKPLSILIILGGIFCIVWLRSGIKSLEYKLGTLQMKEEQLTREYRNLLIQRDDVLSLKRVEYVAIERMGFVFPDRNRVFYVM